MKEDLKNIKKQIKTLRKSIEKLQEELRIRHQVFENIQINGSIDVPNLKNARQRTIEESKVRILDRNVNKLFWQKESAERNIRDLIDEKKVLLERKAFLKNRLKEKSKEKRN
jgi:archaellum component FlaC